MNIADLTRIDRSVEIQAPIERVWRALTNREEISAWFRMAIDGEVKPGNEVWMTVQHGSHANVRFWVRFVELTAPTKFSWQWHPYAVDMSVDYSVETPTTVTFTLEPMESGTRLSVAETGFDGVALQRRAKALEANTGGWATVLGWLTDYAESR